MKKRVLNVSRLDFGKGGVPVITWRWGSNINSQKYVFDYIGWDKVEKSEYTNKIDELGGKIFSYNIKSIEVLKEIRQAIYLKKIVSEEKYEIVHIQGSNTLSQFIYSFASKKGGAKKIIVHAHSANVSHPGKLGKILKRISHEVFKPLIPLYATDFLACSRDAGKWMYPKRIMSNLRVINNGISVDNFTYSKEVREQIRRNLGWEDAFVIGHVGRFSYQKNHDFIIEMFKYILSKHKNARLLLIGVGELQDSIMNKVHLEGLDSYVFHIESTPYVNEYLQAMDCFVLPSFYEGLPIVGVEAQAAGLPLIVSDAISNELKISDLVYTCKINAGPICWENCIENIMTRKIDRSKYSDIVRKSGYSIEESVEELERVYSDK